MALNLDNLSQEDELLLMKFFDGECGLLERIRARKLVQRSTTAGNYMRELAVNAANIKDWESEFPKQKVDLWTGIERRISQEERLIGVSPKESIFDLWAPRLGWGLSGAFATAAVGWLVAFNKPVSETIPYAVNLPVVIQTSNEGLATQRSFHSNVEVDWLRSNGKLSLIQDPVERTTILWVKRPKQSVERFK